MVIRLGTRGSQLARTQSEQVAAKLRELGHQVELVVVRTEGDVNLTPLRQLGGIGVFAAALRSELLSGRVDIAVHSYKDLPTAAVPGLVVGAVPSRQDPRDVLISDYGDLSELPSGARVGTGSPRRAAQLLAQRPDLEIVDIRGNVDTRVRFVSEGRLDAVVLAAAGLNRLGRSELIGSFLDLWPAPAQGALAIECRAADAELRDALQGLEDPMTRFAVTAERAVLATLQAGCAAPVATRTSFQDDQCFLAGRVISETGAEQVEASGSVSWETSDPADLGQQVARGLLDAGAGDITDLQASAPTKLADFHNQ